MILKLIVSVKLEKPLPNEHNKAALVDYSQSSTCFSWEIFESPLHEIGFLQSDFLQIAVQLIERLHPRNLNGRTNLLHAINTNL